MKSSKFFLLQFLFAKAVGEMLGAEAGSEIFQQRRSHTIKIDYLPQHKEKILPVGDTVTNS
jgi:hypothetical protein